MSFDKAALRARIRAERDLFVANGEPPIDPPAQFLARLAHGLTIAYYFPKLSEADPSPLARAAVEHGCEIALPHVTRSTEPMRFLSWDSEEDLIPGP